MVEVRIREGKAAFRIPSITKPCFTYYKIIGSLSSGAPAVIVAHGGPGTGHEYLLTFSELWYQYGLPVVFYDQIGCAASTHLQEKAGDRSFWQEQLFQDELDNLIDHLDLREGPGYHLLGQSWGGMLGSAFASRQPRGLKRLVLASALASRELGDEGSRLLRGQMPPDMRQGLEEAEKKREWDSPAYKRAADYMARTHMCRTDPFPPTELLPALKHLNEDTTVHRTMRGPAPLTTDGSLNGWTVVPRLRNIAAPTLVYNGEFDTSHDVAQVPFFELIPRVRWVTIPGGGHMCHIEGDGRRERILKLVGDFLTQEEPDSVE